MTWDSSPIFNRPEDKGEASNNTGDESASVSYCARSLSTISKETGGGRIGFFSGIPRGLPTRTYADGNTMPASEYPSSPPRTISLPFIVQTFQGTEDGSWAVSKDSLPQKKRRSFTWFHSRKAEIIGALAVVFGAMIVLIAVLMYYQANSTESIDTRPIPPTPTAAVPAPQNFPAAAPAPVSKANPEPAPVAAPIAAPVMRPVLPPEAEPDIAPASVVLPAPTSSPDYTTLFDALVGEGISDRAALTAEDTAQSLAYQWIVGIDSFPKIGDYPSPQRFALATLYFSTGGRLASATWASCSAVPEKASEPPSESTRCVVDGKDLVCAEPSDFVECADGSSTETRWLSGDECAWYGVTCDEGGHVIAIRLPSNGLFGELPREVGGGALPKLEVLDLHDNDLLGPVPSHIGTLTNLVELNLELNELTSQLPEELWNLKKLEFLLLSNNKLTGTLSERMGQLESIRWLSLKSNAFVGDIPFNMRKLQTLEVVELQFNAFEGQVPEMLCDAPSLVDFSSDCLPRGRVGPLVECSCCTVCCGKKKCKDVK